MSTVRHRTIAPKTAARSTTRSSTGKSKKSKADSTTASKSKTKSKAKAKAPAEPKQGSRKTRSQKAKELPLKVIPLGGLCEIGKNMTAFEYGNDIVIIDCGMAFPEESMPGVDSVIQDYTYIRENADRLRGIILTHGHEDHIGGLPFFCREFKCPIYGGKLTIELVRHKLSENGIYLNDIRLEAFRNGERVKLGNSFEAEFVRVNHSIADSYAIALRTPVGVVLHSGDFKVDYTPINGKVIDLQRFGQIGKEGVLLFMCESTNVEIEGNSPSERHVGEAFQRLFKDATGRIIVATFSSHVHRMQQIFTAAEKYGRHVCLSGRSMINVFKVANSLGYIEMKSDTLIDIGDIEHYNDNEIVILTTGSQAEPMSALSRMAYASHKAVGIRQGDTVIISADPIPGNEKPIYRVINELYRQGATVIYHSLEDVHVSGHAYRNEIKLLHTLVNPKYVMPVHGEYRMLHLHKKLAISLGTPEENVFVLNNGDVLSLTSDSASITDSVPASAVLIDGKGAADINSKILTERKHLGEDGVVSIALVVDKKAGYLVEPPAVNSIGFVFEEEKYTIHEEICARIVSTFPDVPGKEVEAAVNHNSYKEQIRGLCFSKTRKRPLVVFNVIKI
ncbi:ribonuclease J [Ruminococcaceae bacterium YRB3002]|nr:ribonuclease J [Ruminococcaceae bacterium YRB3002]